MAEFFSAPGIQYIPLGKKEVTVSPPFPYLKGILNKELRLIQDFPLIEYSSPPS